MTRPDVQCALHKCAVWQNKPSVALHRKLIHIVMYLARTPHLGLVFRRPQKPFSPDNPLLTASCDASFGTEPQSRSRIGWFFQVAGCLVSWDTKLTTRIMSSSTEA